jgi:hypothetical protein
MISLGTTGAARQGCPFNALLMSGVSVVTQLEVIAAEVGVGEHLRLDIADSPSLGFLNAGCHRRAGTK